MGVLQDHLEAHQPHETVDGWEGCHCGWRSEDAYATESGIYTYAAHVEDTFYDGGYVVFKLQLSDLVNHKEGK